MAGDGAPAPSSGRPGPDEEDAELLRVLAALGAGRSHQEVAVEVLGADAAEPWYTDGGERSKARRRIDKAKALRDGGYKAFLDPRRKRRRRRVASPNSGPEGRAPRPA